MLIITIAYDTEKGTIAWGPLDTDTPGSPKVSLLYIARVINLVQQSVFSKLEASASNEKEEENEKA